MGARRGHSDSDSDRDSDSDDDFQQPGQKKWMLVGAVVGGIILVAGIVLLAVHHNNASGASAKPCAGFEKCPEYPKPFLFGTWPETYKYTGKFPKDFVWGLGTASYQIEGAYNEGGRGASIWDTFSGANTVDMPGGNCSYCCKEAPCPMNEGMADKGATGNVACNSYHMFDTDIALMKAMNLKNYRFSIAWPRMFPTGAASGPPNKDAVDFYSDFIDALIAAGITPYVTLYHWDLPQALLSPPEFGAWWARDNVTGEPKPQILPNFLHYVDTCFNLFGARVKTWITFNEAWTFTYLASGYGKAPSVEPYMNMTIDPWIAGHNVLIAHAHAVNLYRTKYAVQGGKIGITNNCDWREPHSEDPGDIASAERAVLFQLGWYSDPIFGGKGDYPPEMRKLYGDRLPQFSDKEKKLLNGSADFYGLNHYGTGWAAFDGYTPGADTSYAKVTEGDPRPFPQATSIWLFGSGWGFRKILNWVKNRYNSPIIYVTEGGWSLASKNAVEGARDSARMYYYANYSSALLSAINEDGVDVRGYFAWSLMDNYEWERGYVERFGTVFNDFNFGYDPNAPTNQHKQPTPDGQIRTRKDSNCWLEAVWTTESLVSPAGFECVKSSVFIGKYTDNAHMGCERELTQKDNGVSGTLSGTQPGMSMVSACGGMDKDFDPLPVTFSDTTIIIDFTPIGGKKMQGFWNNDKKTIFWGDGNSWVKK